MRQLQLDFTHVAMEALRDDRAFESIRARRRVATSDTFSGRTNSDTGPWA